MFCVLPDEDSSRQGRDRFRGRSSARSPRTPQEMVRSPPHLTPASLARDVVSSVLLLSLRQVCGDHQESRLRRRTGARPLPPVAPPSRRVVSVGLAAPAAAGARQLEEAGLESTISAPGTTAPVIRPEQVDEWSLPGSCLRSFVSRCVSGVRFRYEGPGVLDGLSVLPRQDPQRQQRR